MYQVSLPASIRGPSKVDSIVKQETDASTFLQVSTGCFFILGDLFIVTYMYLCVCWPRLSNCYLEKQGEKNLGRV